MSDSGGYNGWVWRDVMPKTYIGNDIGSRSDLMGAGKPLVSRRSFFPKLNPYLNVVLP